MSGGSIRFRGNSSSNLYIPPQNAVDMAMGDADFTIEWFQFLTDTRQFTRVFSVGTYANGTATIAVSIENDRMILWINSTVVLICELTPYKNQWVHLAICRSGSIIRAFKNGINIGTASSVHTIDNFTHGLRIGNESMPTDDSAFMGYITNFHWINGVAIYTFDFAPLYIPISLDITEKTTLLLLTLNESTAYNDNSLSGRTIQANNTSWETNTPFPFFVAPAIDGDIVAEPEIEIEPEPEPEPQPPPQPQPALMSSTIPIVAATSVPLLSTLSTAIDRTISDQSRTVEVASLSKTLGATPHESMSNCIELDIVSISNEQFMDIFYYKRNGKFAINQYYAKSDYITLAKQTVDDTSFNLMSEVVSFYEADIGVLSTCWRPIDLMTLRKQLMGVESINSFCKYQAALTKKELIKSIEDEGGVVDGVVEHILKISVQLTNPDDRFKPVEIVFRYQVALDE